MIFSNKFLKAMVKSITIYVQLLGCNIVEYDIVLI